MHKFSTRLAAVGVAAATVLSGLSFGSAATAATADDPQAGANSNARATPYVATARGVLKIGATYYAFGSGSTLIAHSSYASAAAGAPLYAIQEFNGSHVVKALGSADCIGYTTQAQAPASYVIHGTKCTGAGIGAGIRVDSTGKISGDVDWNLNRVSVKNTGELVKNGSPKYGFASEGISSVRSLTASVSSVNHTAKTAKISGVATKGAQVTAKGKTVTANTSNGAWEMTVEGLDVGANSILVEQKINGTKIDGRTVTATVNAVNGGVNAAGAGTPATIEAGKSADAWVGVKTNAKLDSIKNGKIELKAPAGTTFTKNQTALNGQWRHDDSDTWSNSDALKITGTVSADGTTFTGTVPDFESSTDNNIRWKANLTAATNPAAGTRDLGFTVTGETNHGKFTTTGNSPITIAPRPAVNGGFNAAGIGTAATVEAGKSADAYVGVKTNAKLNSIKNGKIELKAPAGTTFTKNQTALNGQWRHDDSDTWSNSDALKITGTVSADGTTFTGTVPDFESSTDNNIRWKANLTAATNPAAGTRDLGFTVTGETNHGKFTTTGNSPITVKQTVVNGGFNAAGIGTAATVEAGKSVDVSLGAKANAAVTSLTGTKVTLKAPKGTKFTASQKELTGKFKHPDQGWLTTPSLTVNGAVTDNGATFTGTIEKTNNNFHLASGIEVKWIANLTAAADATAGTDDLGFTVTGTTNHGAFTTTGQSPVTITVKATRPLQVDTPANGSTTANRTPYFSGWGTPGAAVKVTDGQNGTEIVSTTIDPNGWWGDISSAGLADGTHTFVITATVNGASETINRTVTIDSIRDLTIDAPTNDSTAWWPNPTLIGWGTPGGHVTITDESADVIGEEDINVDGWFGATSTKALANGEHTLTFTQTANGSTNTKTVKLTIAHKPFMIDAPAEGSSNWWPKPSFIGWATPGAAIEIRDTDNTTVLATVRANDDGWFGVVSDPELSYGEHTLHFRQTFNGATTEKTVKHTIAADALVIESPTEGYTNWWPKPSYIGWATPGAIVRVTDTDGTPVDTVSANSDGWFGKVSDKALAVGAHTLTFTQVANGQTLDSKKVNITITG